MTRCKEGQPTQTVWLVIKRTLGNDPTYWYYISHAPISTPLSRFVWLRGIRWAVEQCFGEAKTELGMAHYELRKFTGWHHHMWTCMLAHFFLWHVKIHVGKKAPALTVSQVRWLLEVVLPLKTFTVEDVLRLVKWTQRRNHETSLAHRKRREEEG